MYPSPDHDLSIAAATQRERIARGWRPRLPWAAWSAAFLPGTRRS